MPALTLDRLEKHYPGPPSHTAAKSVSLNVHDGEFISLLGPSGCGKTTVLRMVAGLIEPTGGRILVDGRDITALPTNKRNIGLVFQSYALFPHMSVFENVAFGLRRQGVQGPEGAVPAHERVRERRLRPATPGRAGPRRRCSRT